MNKNTLKLMVTFGLLLLESPLVHAQDGPMLVTDELIFDFGEIKQGEGIEHTFSFTNEGDAELAIIEVRGTAGLEATTDKEVYSPGESGTLHLAYDPLPHHEGSIVRSAYIETNDPNHEKIRFQLRGDVLTRITFWPKSLYFHNIRPGEIKFQQIEVSSNTVEKLQLSDPRSKSGKFSAEVVRIDDTNFEIKITVDATKLTEPVELFHDALLFDTNVPGNEQQLIPVSIHAYRTLSVSPINVRLFASEPGESQEVRISSSEGQTFSIEELKSDLEIISLVMQSDKDTEKTFLVRLSNEAPKGKFTGSIIVKTDFPDRPEIVIPVTGSIL